MPTGTAQGRDRVDGVDEQDHAGPSGCRVEGEGAAEEGPDHVSSAVLLQDAEAGDVAAVGGLDGQVAASDIAVLPRSDGAANDETRKLRVVSD